MENSPAERPQVLVLPPVLFAGGFVLALLCQRLWEPRHLDVFGQGLGVIFAASGVLLLAWAIQEFKKAGTNFQCDQPVTALVTSGPYRYSRNPIYIALNLIYLGLGLLIDNLWVLLLWPFMLILLYYGIVLREEAFLQQKFGTVYTTYCHKVGRWISFLGLKA